jgi:anti-sigma-K factor RskA
MMHDFLGYLCGALEVEETTRFEETVTQDGEIRRQLEIHRRALVPLSGDCEECCPPESLAARVCEMLRKSRGGAQQA